MSAWLSGGALGAVLGGTLLLLCGRPAANLVMAALAACASLYIFDVTPAECWQWLCNVGGSVHEKGLAVHEQNAVRRAERLAARAAEEAEAEEYDGYDDDFPEDEEDYSEEEPEAPAFHIQPPIAVKLASHLNKQCNRSCFHTCCKFNGCLLYTSSASAVSYCNFTLIVTSRVFRQRHYQRFLRCGLCDF